jgi:hypothetical protein
LKFCLECYIVIVFLILILFFDHFNMFVLKINLKK